MNNIIRALRRFVINLTGKNKTIFFLILILYNKQMYEVNDFYEPKKK